MDYRNDGSVQVQIQLILCPFLLAQGKEKLQTLQVIPSQHHVSFSQFQLFHYCNVTQALNSVGIPAVYSVGIPAVSI